MIAGDLRERISQFALRPVTVVRSFRRVNLRSDTLAGLTVAVVAIPQSIAYAAIAGLPPEYGLYTAAVAAIAGALWGSSSYLSTGPTNAVSILVLSILAPLVAIGTPEYLMGASVMALMVGLLCLGFGVTGLGMLVNFASRAVLLGFAAGAGVLIAAGQIKHLLRLDIASSPSLYKTLSAVGEDILLSHWPSLLLGLGTVLVIVIVRRISGRLPASLIGILMAGTVVALVGVESMGVAVFGEVSRSLPGLTPMSTNWLFDEEMFTALVTGSLAVAALGVVEAISIARELARQGGQRIDVNQELVGQGVANIAAGAFSGYACSGSFTRSALSFQAGARSPFAGILTGLLVLASVMAFGPLAAYLPKAALAGMIFFVAYTMLDQRAIRRIMQTSRTETGIMVTTFVATLVVPLQFAVLSGVILSLAIYIYQSSMPVVQPVVPDENYRHFVERPDAPTCPQLAVVNIRGAIFFGAAGYVEDHLVQLYEENPGQRHLLLRMHGVHQCDLSGLEALEGIVSLYRESGGDIYLVQVRPNVRRLMETSGFEATLGKDRFLTQENAVDWLFEEILDPAVCCYECEVRVFAECQALVKHPYERLLPTASHRAIDPQHHLSVIELVSALHSEHGGASLIDVREPEEYRAGHLHGSRLMPLREIIDKAGSLPHDRPIYLICRSGRRSTRAMHWFLDLGFTNVYNLGGGILSWKASGGPLEVS